MALRRRFLRGRLGGVAAEDVGCDDELLSRKPLGKFIVRFRPLLQEEVNRGETLCVTTARGEKVTLRPPQKRTKKAASSSAKTHQNHPPAPEQIEYDVDRALAPTANHAEVYHAAAVRLVDKVIAGDDGLLLLAGTPGSGRSHTLWGHSPNAPGLFPRSLAALARGCRGGNGTPFYPLPPSASTFVVRVCAAEVHGGDVRDLLPAANSISSGDDARRREHSRSSPGRTGRWTLSSRGLLSSLPSSSGSNRGGEGDGGRSPQRRVRRGVGRRFYADDPSALTPKALVTSRVLVGVSEVTVGGVDEALQFVRHSVSSRRKEAHLVLAAKLVADDSTSSGGGKSTSKATGELVFVELGDCSAGDLPEVLRTALAHLKLDTSTRETMFNLSTSTGSVSEREALRAVAGPATRSVSCSSLQRPTALPLAAGPSLLSSMPARHSALGGLQGSPLLALLESLAGNDPGRTVSCSTLPRLVTGTVASPAKAELAGGAGVGHGKTGPLVVSVVATLRAGTGYYEEKQAILEVLAKSKRRRPFPGLGRALSFNRILSIPSFVWKSQAGYSSSAPGRAVPSAPPLSPGGSGASSCSSTVSASSAKAAYGPLPGDHDRALPLPTQHAAPQRSPPPSPSPTPSPSPPKPANIAATIIAANHGQTIASAGPTSSPELFATPWINAAETRPHQQNPWSSSQGPPPSPLPKPVVITSRKAASGPATLFAAHSETIATLLAPSAISFRTGVDRLPGIIERSPWTEGVRKGAQKTEDEREGDTGARRGRDYQRSKSKGKGSKTRREGSLLQNSRHKRNDRGVSGYKTRNDEKNGHSSRARRSQQRQIDDGSTSILGQPVASGAVAAFGTTAAVKSDRNIPGAPGEMESAEHVAREIRPATGSSTQTDRLYLGTSGDDNSSAASEWFWEGESRRQLNAREGSDSKAARRTSPLRCDSLDLGDLTREELIERLLQAEKASRFWKAQHAHMAKQVENLIRTTRPRRMLLPRSAGALDSRGEKPQKLYKNLPSDRKGGRDALNGPGSCAGALKVVQTGIEQQSADMRNRRFDDEKNDGGRDREAEGEGSGGFCGAMSSSFEPADGDGGPGENDGVWGTRPQGMVEKLPGDLTGRTPPGTADARRTISASKLSFKELRAVFADNRSVPLSSLLLGVDCVPKTDADAGLMTTRTYPSESLRPTATSVHVAKDLESAKAERALETAGGATAAAFRGGKHASNTSGVSVASEENARTTSSHDPDPFEVPDIHRVRRDLSNETQPRSENFYLGVAGSGGSSTVGIDDTFSGPSRGSTVSSAASAGAAEVDSSANSSARVVDNFDGSSPGGGRFSPPFLSPPSFRKPKAQRRVRELEAKAQRRARQVEAMEAMEVEAATALATEVRRPASDSSVDETELVTAGDATWNGVSDGGKKSPDAQRQLREAADGFLPSGSGIVRAAGRSSLLAIGRGRSWGVSGAQRGSGVETCDGIIASMAMASRPQTRTVNPSSDTSGSLGSTAPALLAPPPPQADGRRTTASASQQVGPATAVDSVVRTWSAHTLRQRSSPIVKFDTTTAAEDSASGSPWTARALRRKALTGQGPSGTVHKRAESASPPQRQRHDKQGRGKKSASVGGGGQGNTTMFKRNSFSRSKGSSDSASGLFRNGSGGWKDRPAGIGPWPIVKGRASNGSARSSSPNNPEETNDATIDSSGRLSISHIKPEHAAGLRELRKRVEDRQVIARNMKRGTTAFLSSGSKWDSLGRRTLEAPGMSKHEEQVLTKPWGNGTGFGLSEEGHDGGRRGRQSGFKLVIPVKWEWHK